VILPFVLVSLGLVMLRFLSELCSLFVHGAYISMYKKALDLRFLCISYVSLYEFPLKLFQYNDFDFIVSFSYQFQLVILIAR